MGMVQGLFGWLFGGGLSDVRKTVEVFRPNAEAGAMRDATLRGQALAEHSAEFAAPRKGAFDRFMDGVNRLPRPMMALGTLGLFVSAMWNPVWFGVRMQGLALVPDPLWWLLGAVVSFYFGARYQFKGQDFQRSMAQTLLRAPQVRNNIDILKAGRAGALAGQNADPNAGQNADPNGGQNIALDGGPNAALHDWGRWQKAQNGGKG